MKIYTTRDLQLAATLSALGHKTIRLENHKTKPNTKLFVFDNKENKKGNTPKQDAKSYYSKELTVEPNLLFHYNSTLREWVRNEIRLA